MKLHVLEIFILFLFSVNALAQKQIPKGYQNITDTSEISKLMEKAQKYENSYPDSLIYIIDIVDKLAKKTNSKLHLIKSFLIRGAYHKKRAEYQEALDNYFAGNELATQIGNESYINQSNLLISSVYLHLAYYSLSEKYILSSLEYYEKTKNNKGMGGAYLNMTFIKIGQKDYENAKKYGDLAYQYFATTDYYIGTTMALGNLCDINLNLHNYKSAIEYGKKALSNSKKYNHLSMNSFIFLTMGDVYSKLNKFDSAQYYYDQSINSTKMWPDNYMLSKCKQSYAMLYTKQGNYRKALSIAIEAYNIADTTNIVQEKASAANLIAKYFSKTGNYKSAFKYKEIESQINDSLFTKEKYKVQNEMEAIYQSQKKENTIASLSKEKEIEVLKNKQSKYYIGFLLGLMLILAFTSLLIFRNSRLNARRKTAELEQRLLRTQMNPHFIFNALSCIQEYIMDKKPVEAGSYLSGFAKLMRSILNNSSREFILLEDEIETLKHYLQLQKLRFPNKLDYEIIVSESLEIDELVIPPMLSQPFIENSVNHGIAKKKEGTGKVKVEFFEKENSLFLKIEDDGVGIPTYKAQKDKKHESMAIQITKSRIANFQKAYKKGVFFEIGNIIDKTAQVSGVQVLFRLPKKYSDVK